jgi:opacity protein-like surface antigen
MMIAPTLAAAQPVQGLYVGGNVGANFSGSLLASRDSTEIYTSAGPLGLASLGWGFGNGLRAEIEGSYRSNDIGGITTLRTNGLMVPLANPTGSAATYAAMANIAYDLPLGLPVQPYIGAGLGYGRLDLGNAGGTGRAIFHLPENNTFIGPAAVSFGSAGALAYQAIAGASLPLKGLPGLEMTFEYRFFGTARTDVPVARVSTAIGDTVNGRIPSSTTRNGFAVLDNSLVVGVRYAFDAPPPTAPDLELPAQGESGWYVSGSVGGYFRETTTTSETFDKTYNRSIRASGTETQSFDPGVIGNAALGYHLSPQFRVEAEIGYFSYSASTMNPFTTDPRFPRLNGSTFIRQTGDDWSRFTGTVNVFYDFPGLMGVSPFVGTGIGASANHRTNGFYTAANGGTFDSSGGASTQGLWLLEGGVSVPLTENLSVVPAYRYVHYFAGNEDVAHIVKLELRYSF